MVTNLCFGLACSLIPILIDLFNLQTALQLSKTGHAMAEVLILCGIYWLFVQILRLDEQLYLRNLLPQKPHLKATIRPSGKERAALPPVRPIPKAETATPEPSNEPALHGPQNLFGNILKHNRTTKPL